MKPISEWIAGDGFLQQVFDAVPCGILIMDRNRGVHAVNRVMEQTFGPARLDAVRMRGGELLKCIHATENPKGCGFSDFCGECRINQTATAAINGEKVFRNKAHVQLVSQGKTRLQVLLVSAAPIEIGGGRFAVVVLEDITELNTLRGRLKTEHSFSGIVGRDPAMLEIFDTIREVVDFHIPILIQGESGTGKELVASAIHNEGPRADRPFVPVNCGALPEGLIESELFGHVKGAFTGAVRDKKGRFELADGGTLFLDEVGELPKAIQPKLLRVLQEGKFEPVGGEAPVSVDVRIVTATNKDLKQEMKKNNFREDLYYRINVVPIVIPPLRKRRNDVPLLIDHFLKKAEMEGHPSPGVSPEAMALMMDYPWPGNIRELQSAIWFGIVKSKGLPIRVQDLPMELQQWHRDAPARGPAPKLNPGIVRQALKAAGGNKAKAARLLGVGRATLYRFLTDYPDAGEAAAE
ncbi:MAG: sigma-54 interaction domain-containing protein [Thermodesulfobacteriota bacterium]